jgi:hypothetical protein
MSAAAAGAVAGALAIVPSGGAAQTSTTVVACSVIDVARVAGVVGYPVRLGKGETAQDCNIIASPIKIGEDGRPVRPTIVVEIDPTRPGLYKTVMTQAGGRTAKTAGVPGLGSHAFVVSIPSLAGSFFVGAEVHGILLQVSVGQAVRPIAKSQAVALAKLIASML